MPNTKHTYYAEIAPDGTVRRVIVSDAAFVAKLPGTWVQTWMEDGAPHGRKNYAGPGHKFDAGRNAFIPPRPADAIALDETTCRWIVPAKPMPGGT